MEFHIRFKGTPKQLITVVAVLMQRWRQLGYLSPLNFANCAEGRDPDWVVIELRVDSIRVITFKPVRVIAHRIPGGESEISVVCQDKDWPDFEPTWRILYDVLIRQGWVDVPPHLAAELPEDDKSSLGRHTLEPDELIYRLAKAAEAEDIKARCPDKLWKEIALEIAWSKGTGTSGLKLLQYARDRLAEARKRGEQDLLAKVEEKRKEMKKSQ